jgi:hypothetical protein
MPRTEPRVEHEHTDAYKLLSYRSKDGQHEETIWNSRDGIAPVLVPSRDGKQTLYHCHRERDLYAPDHQPQEGERIIVDLQLDRALELARQHVREWWMHPTQPMREHPVYALMTQEQAIGYLAKTYMGEDGEPDVITVTAYWLERGRHCERKMRALEQLHLRPAIFEDWMQQLTTLLQQSRALPPNTPLQAEEWRRYFDAGMTTRDAFEAAQREAA